MTAQPLIFVVEDDTDINGLMVEYLRRAEFRVYSLFDGAEVMKAFTTQAPDLVLLDVALPNEDGFSLCRRIRAKSSVPIMMVTARVEEIDRLLGLELGADDYVCKPFSPREVVARVKAILRRGQPGPESNLTTSRDDYTARCNGRVIELTRTEFELLDALVSHPERVFSRNQLSDLAYPDRRIITERTIDSHIKNIRRKLEDVGAHSSIRSVYGVGYRLETAD